jgi:hypothetical protein
MIDLESIGIRVGFLVAGLFGAVLMTTKRAAATIGQTTLSIVGGAASANYMTPIVLKVTKLDPNDSGYAIAFLLGFGGLKAVEKLAARFIGETHEPPHRTQRGSKHD